MSVPPEVQAMHLRHFDAYISALVTRLTQTDEHYNFITLCERIERLLSIDRQFYEDREEPDERHDEPLRLRDLQEAVRDDGRIDVVCDAAEVLPAKQVLPWEGPDSEQQEPVEEPDVKATPTMSAEEEQQWAQEQKAKPKGAAVASTWTPERRQAARDRALNQGLGSKVNRHVAPTPKTPSLSGSTPPEAPALASTAPSLPEQAPTPRDDSPAGDLTPEAAAHQDAAIILAELEPDPLPTRETITLGNRPECACPDGWLKPGESWMATDRALTHRHHAACPLHRHKHRFGVAPDGDGNIIGRCECGDTELRPLEPARAKVDNRAKAVAS